MADPGATLLPAAALVDALFEHAPVGLAFWDRELRYRRINERLAAMNGLPAAEHLGRRPVDLLPELGPRLEAILGGVLASAEPLRDIDVAGETPAQPGLRRHWRSSYFPVRDEDGTVAGVTGLVVEVTGELRADERAAAAREHGEAVGAQLAALYAALPIGVAFLSPDLRYQRVNEALARMNGRPLDAHAGASIEDILGARAAQLRPILEEVGRTGEAREIAVTLSDADEPLALEALYFPVTADGEALLGIGAVVRDVTRSRQLEEEQSRLLREALLARAEAEAARVRADDARDEAERARADSDRARVRETFLAQAGREMAASLDVEMTLRAVVRLAVPDVADWAAAMLQERDGRLRVVAIAHADPARERLALELIERYPTDPDAPHGAASVVRSAEPEILLDVDPARMRASARDADQLRLLEALEVRQSATFPLRAPTGVLGVLAFLQGESGRRFSEEDLVMLNSLSSRAALHVQNAQLYTERTHIASTLQASLRPRALPQIPGVDLAARFLPAGDHNEVGGDFYDVFRSGDGVWSAIVGDVAGKGPEAAAITALARHTLRTASMLHDDPAASLELLNRALVTDAAGRDFCTVLYARICEARPPGDGLDFRFANGGHPAPLLLRADGSVEAVDAGRGPLVGAVDGVHFAEGTFRLRPGELLLLYTDGVTEVRTSDLELGERELRATLAAHAGASAEEVVEAVQRRALELQPGGARDDIALVAFRLR